jgi:hypothetical protein
MAKSNWIQTNKGKWINMDLISKVDFTAEGAELCYSWPGVALDGGVFAVHYESVDTHEAEVIKNWLRYIGPV